ncbi:50S ribosomal protein L32 [Candidatus Peregrinibacteria bacterium CG10_big_fil_rev_8_21_14_0_10_36_19]|nr:MAG: 50S ribosomal protein L32 [Candidatus Peregrinibacteria bacterium CG10_big_fil_rev_8_21_14_0_10_36_19]
MAKHPVPKKKTNKSDTKRRYGSFKTKVLKKLTNLLNLASCPDCGSKIPAHRACPDCGKYKGRQVIDKQKKVDKITKIKA